MFGERSRDKTDVLSAPFRRAYVAKRKLVLEKL